MKTLLCLLALWPQIAFSVGFLRPAFMETLQTRLRQTEEGQWLLGQTEFQQDLPSLHKATKDSTFFKLSLANMCLILFEMHCHIPYIRSEFLLEYGTEALATGVNLGKPYTPYLQFFFYAAAIEFEIYKFMTTSSASAYEDYDFSNMAFYLQSLQMDFPEAFDQRQKRLFDETARAMEAQAIGLLMHKFAFVNEVIHRKFSRDIAFIVSDMLVDMTKRLREEGAIGHNGQ